MIPCVGNISQFCGGLLKNYVFKTFIPVPSAKGIGNCPTLAKFDVNNGNTIASENPLDRNDNVANVVIICVFFKLI